jgi:hypothetical protein
MSKELAIIDFQTQLAELDKIQETCKKLLQTRHYQALGEVGIHAIIARAKALGIHPFEALNGGFHCINGKVGMSTEMMAALVRRKGHSIQKDSKSTNECVILNGKRADNGDTWTCSFTRSDAEAAGLWNTATWKKYPEVMLYNRCMSKLFRQLFPDLSLGAGYVEDELREITKTGDYKTTIEVEAEPIKQETKPVPIEDKTQKKEEDQKQEKVELSGEKISHEQYIFIQNAIGDDTDFEERMLRYLASHKIEGLKNLPIEYYDRYLAWAKRECKQPKNEIKNAVA